MLKLDGCYFLLLARETCRYWFGALVLSLSCIGASSAIYADTGLWKEFAHPDVDLHAPIGLGMYTTVPEMFTVPPPNAPVERPMLIILMEFPDSLHTEYHETPFWDDMIFSAHDSGDPPSTVQIINTSLNDLVQIVPATAGDHDGVEQDGIIGWVQSSMPTTDPFWTDSGPEKARAEAIRLADPFFDFSLYDISPADGVISYNELAIYVIFASPNACDAHGHPNPSPCDNLNAGIARVTFPRDVAVESGTMNVTLLVGGGAASVTTNGLIAHELGHMSFGLADLYQATGCPGYTLLPTGYWCDDAGLYPPNPGRYALIDTSSNVLPIHMTPWAKIHLGTTRPQVVKHDGTYSLYNIENDRDLPTQQVEPEALIVYDPLRSGPYDEYFVLENRVQEWEISHSTCPDNTRALMDQGLLLWQINENESLFRKMIRLVRHNGYWPEACDENSAWDGAASDYYDITPLSLPRDTSWTDGTPSYVEIYDVSPAGPSLSLKIRMTPLFVDHANSGTETGTDLQPFDTVQEAIDAIPEPPRTIDISAGTYAGPITMSKPVTLRSWRNGSVVIGH